jgi:hypothetical protein
MEALLALRMQAAGDAGAVAELVRATLSAERQVRVGAEEELRTREARGPAFVLTVAVLAVGRDEHELHTRSAAAILLKNVVSRRWGSRGGVSEDEKRAVRMVLLSSAVCEPARRVSAQLNLVVGLIARADWPAQWPELIPALNAGVASQGEADLTVPRRSLQCLLAVLTELSGRTLPAHKRQLTELLRRVMGGVQDTWMGQVHALVDGLGPSLDANAHVNALERGEVMLASARILRVIVTRGWSQEQLLAVAEAAAGTPRARGTPAPQPLAYLEELCGGKAQDRLIVLARECRSWPWLRECERRCGRGGDEADFGLLCASELVPLSKTLAKAARVMFKTVNELQQHKSVAFLPFLSPFLDRAYRVCHFFIEAHKSFAVSPQQHQHQHQHQKQQQPQQQAGQQVQAEQEQEDGDEEEGAEEDGEKLAVLSAQFLSNVLSCKEYRPGGAQVRNGKLITGDGDLALSTQAAAALESAEPALLTFFSHERTAELVRAVTRRALPLRQRDVDEWFEDPEAFACSEAEPAPGEALRPACENLLLSLVDRFEAVAAPLVVAALHEGEELFRSQGGRGRRGGEGGGIAPATALLEAALLAVGISAFYLRERMDLGALLERTVFPILDVQQAGTGLDQSVLRRRALWLLGCVSADVSHRHRGLLFHHLLGLVEAAAGVTGAGSAGAAAVGEDALVIGITAAQSLNGLVQAWDFEIDPFAPFQERALCALLRLSARCESPAARLAQMQTLVSVVDRVGAALAHVAGDLVAPVAAMWVQADGAEWSLWKMEALVLFEKVVAALGEGGHVDAPAQARAEAQAVAVLARELSPLVARCLQRPSDDFVYLAEPAVRLWAALARAAPDYPAELHALLGALAPALSESEGSLLPLALDLVEAHTVLGVAAVLRDFGAALVLPLLNRCVLVEAMAQRLAAREEARALRVAELLLRSREPAALQLLAPLLWRLAQFSVSAQPQRGAPGEAEAESGNGTCDGGSFSDEDVEDDDVVGERQRGASANADANANASSTRVLPSPQGPEPPLLTAYLSLLARAFLEFGPAATASAVAAAAGAARDGAQDGSLCRALVDAWLANFGALGSSPLGVWRRKLWALALLQQLAETLPRMDPAGAALKDRLSPLLNVWADAHAELGLAPLLDAAKARLLLQQLQGQPPESTFAQRKTALLNGDMVATQDLEAALRESLRLCRSAAPPGLLERIVDADPSLAALAARLS